MPGFLLLRLLRRIRGISPATAKVVTFDHLLFRPPHGARGNERQEQNGKDHEVQFHAISPLFKCRERNES